MIPIKIFNNAALAAALLALASLAMLGGAYYFQYFDHLQPCMLCLYQRVPHAVVAVLGGAAFFVAWKGGKPKRAAFLILLCALADLAGTGLGIYHTGVEQHWWESALEACTNPMIATGKAKDLLSIIEKAKSVRCDSVPWHLFGLSMASYNAFISAGLAVYATLAALLVTRKANGF